MLARLSLAPLALLAAACASVDHHTGSAAAAGPASTQEGAPVDASAPEATPEHRALMKMVGTWDATLSFPGQDQKSHATAVYRPVGEFWVASDFNGEMMGGPFIGHGIDGYDPAKKKFVSVWVDSWITEVLSFEGTHDAATRTTTMTGMGHDPQTGAPMQYKNVSTMTSDDAMTFVMGVVGPDGSASEMLRIEYTRRK